MDFGPAPAKKSRKKLWLILILAVILVAGAAAALVLRPHQAPKPAQASQGPIVPVSISQAVNFPVYYPYPNKLPKGYTLVRSSFSHPVKNGVAFWVSYDNGKRVVFSDQTKPSDNDLQGFVANYIPLNIDYQTPSGPAKIGAYNNHGTVETLVSLPTTDSTWVVITAPQNINQDDLKQILKAITR